MKLFLEFVRDWLLAVLTVGTLLLAEPVLWLVLGLGVLFHLIF